jgi:peroxiredoxin
MLCLKHAYGEIVMSKVGQPFPLITLKAVNSGEITLGATGGDRWQLVVVYRGLHCPLCKKFLRELNEMREDLYGMGVDVLVVSVDPEVKAVTMKEELGLDLAVAYDLSIQDARVLGLYISNPRSPTETLKPFTEPGTFLIRPDGLLQVADVSNAPFARPDLNLLKRGISIIQERDYPIRGVA